MRLVFQRGLRRLEVTIFRQELFENRLGIFRQYDEA